ncbi:hypothetical protein SAMN04515618_11493 [Collimonas sp. OK307]|uniref:hypothetical protein n=1 Tax=Collimonas sp. OK307 TaxID=1801620 RepID=UPI0008E576DD|nr:hypothetical protein [Collimonas sp. OK307]SFI23527.1 hypothetical protein SAMN04515618_11493 [Collimonas sp. OK307]
MVTSRNVKTGAAPAVKRAVKKPVAAIKTVAKAKPAARSAAKPGPKAASAIKPAAKAVAKPAVKPAAKPQSKPLLVTKPLAAKPALPVIKSLPDVKAKVKKAKLVRDSFTMPADEYQVLGDVKKTFLKAGLEVKKSELLRVGVALIRELDLASLKLAVASLPPVKAGRPKKEK